MKTTDIIGYDSAFPDRIKHIIGYPLTDDYREVVIGTMEQAEALHESQPDGTEYSYWIQTSRERGLCKQVPHSLWVESLKAVEAENEVSLTTGMTRDEREVCQRLHDHGLSFESPINEIARCIPPRLFFTATKLKEDFRQWWKSHENDTPIGVQEGWD
jgi:hypothetical protein